MTTGVGVGGNYGEDFEHDDGEGNGNQDQLESSVNIVIDNDHYDDSIREIGATRTIYY